MFVAALVYLATAIVGRPGVVWILLGLSLSPDLGTYLVAAALIGHATLDVILWRARKVVVRSMAEFCAVLDLTLGVAIVVIQLA